MAQGQRSWTRYIIESLIGCCAGIAIGAVAGWAVALVASAGIYLGGKPDEAMPLAKYFFLLSFTVFFALGGGLIGIAGAAFSRSALTRRALVLGVMLGVAAALGVALVGNRLVAANPAKWGNDNRAILAQYCLAGLG